MRYYDITPKLEETIAVFPGDVPFKREQALDMVDGDNFTLSSLTSTLHVGAHTDSPLHYHPKGKDISDCDLAPYLGDCQVISVLNKPAAHRLEIDDIKDVAINATRIILRTGSFPDPNKWTNDFTALSPELVHYLADKGVVLIGIDTPSVDPAAAKDLISHHAIYERDMRILEGIVLDEVPDGLYTLIALPLPIVGGDASPVRAILLEKNIL